MAITALARSETRGGGAGTRPPPGHADLHARHAHADELRQGQHRTAGELLSAARLHRQPRFHHQDALVRRRTQQGRRRHRGGGQQPAGAGRVSARHPERHQGRHGRRQDARQHAALRRSGRAAARSGGHLPQRHARRLSGRAERQEDRLRRGRPPQDPAVSARPFPTCSWKKPGWARTSTSSIRTRCGRKPASEFSDIDWTREYAALADNPNIRKKRVSARRVLEEIAVTQGESGYPYLLFEGNANRANPIANVGSIKMSNLCSEILQPTLPSYFHAYGQEAKDRIGLDVSCNLAVAGDRTDHAQRRHRAGGQGGHRHARQRGPLDQRDRGAGRQAGQRRDALDRAGRDGPALVPGGQGTDLRQSRGAGIRGRVLRGGALPRPQGQHGDRQGHRLRVRGASRAAATSPASTSPSTWSATSCRRPPKSPRCSRATRCPPAPTGSSSSATSSSTAWPTRS